MSWPACQYSPSTPAALPTPCFPSIAIVRTSCVVTVMTLLWTRSWSHIALRRAALRAGLNLRRFFLAFSFLRKAMFSKIKISRCPLSPGAVPVRP